MPVEAMQHRTAKPVAGVRHALGAAGAILLVLGVMQLSANKASDNGS